MSEKVCIQTPIFVWNSAADKVREHGACRSMVCDETALPDYWWAAYYRNANGYLGLETERDDEGNLVGVTSWARLMAKVMEPAKTDSMSYSWYKINVVVKWLASTGKTVMFVFDSPAELRVKIQETLPRRLRKRDMLDPFWPYPALLEDLAGVQERSIWALRDFVRVREKKRSELSAEEARRYQIYHEVSRHMIHNVETLDTSVKTCRSILEQQSVLREATLGADDGARLRRLAAHESTRQRVISSAHLLEALRDRSVANKERLAQETQLLFYRLAQHDTELSLDLGLEMRKDSTAMRTIALVTLVFLPATFIAALFDTCFFDYDADDGLTVGYQFWIYWAAALPVTALTVALWVLWDRGLSKRTPKSKDVMRSPTFPAVSVDDKA
ncbi:hypothetical protein GMORB2_4391 [Geosmithia morbida]|uniref:Uncharacterized protein n=1 Tax=Geosmithia morbida TaxID=1094350 RepID=A0A9P4YPM5_9HYPO|nr:uncharacterized protein GMORB2_4391 [Geosmithia morbida]KAF4119725.1 hypothetical protein GMORB2_4391 [Geosmithia morbida]